MDRYLNVALTGNRFSGKDSVGILFKKIGVPVFDADSILKFLLNYDLDVSKNVEKCFGKSYLMYDYINPIAFDTDEKMSRLLNIVDYKLFEAYSKFREKYRQYSQYTEFNCSVVFEKRWHERFDYVINVSSSVEDRKYRYQMKMGEMNDYVFKNEIPDTNKNHKADYIIHNFQGGPDVNKRVIKIDSDLSEIYYMRKEEIIQKRNQRSNEFIVGDSIDIRQLTT